MAILVNCWTWCPQYYSNSFVSKEETIPREGDKWWSKQAKAYEYLLVLVVANSYLISIMKDLWLQE